MNTFVQVIPKCYQDSMKLMRVSAEIKEMPNVTQAFAFMATEVNKKTRAKELSTPEVIGAAADDLILAIKSEDETAARKALKAFEKKITSAQKSEGSVLDESMSPKTLEKGIEKLDGANIAIISVPGVYAAALAAEALQKNLNVMMFSDNVSIEDELTLKELGRKKGLLVMGPDCGTAIINGTPLCFANKVAKGPIGIVGASGTGTQEVCAIISALGQGVTHAIGTGGRDLSDKIKAITTIMALEALSDNTETKVIVLISKPPGAEAEKIVMEKIKELNKPVVVAFLGSGKSGNDGNAYYAESLEAAAAKAVALSKGEDAQGVKTAFDMEVAAPEASSKSAKQKYVRGIFTGGTLADEAMQVLKDFVGDIYSNIPLNPEYLLESVRDSKKHTVVDVGDDEFTRGALHPMIDTSYRNERLIQEFSDPETAVVLCDVVLGYGAHNNPASELAKAVVQARNETKNDVAVVAYVCGTEDDPQCLSSQKKILEDCGIIVYPSGRLAAEAAGMIARSLSERSE